MTEFKIKAKKNPLGDLFPARRKIMKIFEVDYEVKKILLFNL